MKSVGHVETDSRLSLSRVGILFLGKEPPSRNSPRGASLRRRLSIRSGCMNRIPKQQAMWDILSAEQVNGGSPRLSTTGIRQAQSQNLGVKIPFLTSYRRFPDTSGKNSIRWPEESWWARVSTTIFGVKGSPFPVHAGNISNL